MKVAVAVFVKTPGLSEIKTRLAKGIGEQKAAEFYLESVAATAAYVKDFTKNSNHTVQGFWAVAEENALEHPLWQEFPTLYQGFGGLGERQHQIYSELKKTNDCVILIGSDSPHMPMDRLAEAVQIVERNPSDFALGPTEDGGYYLFAGGKELPKSAWTNVTYSYEHTRAELAKQLEPEGKVTYLPSLFDIDTVSDYRRLKSKVWLH